MGIITTCDGCKKKKKVSKIVEVLGNVVLATHYLCKKCMRFKEQK